MAKVDDEDSVQNNFAVENFNAHGRVRVIECKTQAIAKSIAASANEHFKIAKSGTKSEVIAL